MHLYKKFFVTNHNKKRNLKLKKFFKKKINIVLLSEKNILRRKTRENHLKF